MPVCATWGLDFSGTTQGAGGVGGLLMVHESSATYLAAHDGRGNVTTLVNAADGSVAAAYEYSPFGELLRQSGSYAASNPIRFSSKFTDVETGLVYHNKRYYSPSQGRFLGRDSINEKGGLNLYGYCGNNAINRWDYLGMFEMHGEISEGYLEWLRWQNNVTAMEAFHVTDTRITFDPIADYQNQNAISGQGSVNYGGYDNGGGGSFTSYLRGGGLAHDVTLNWSSKNIRMGPIKFEPVHQIAIDRALSHLSEADRAILREQQVVADKEQNPAKQYTHAMRNAAKEMTWAGPIPQTIEEAKALANDYVRDKINQARALESDNDRAGAMRELGLALHALQDATSPSHAGFQPWREHNLTEAGQHVLNERIYPGDDSSLFRVTQQTWKYFTGDAELPEDFFAPIK